jgi:hypothetical protein
MVGNMCHISLSLIVGARDHVGKVPLVDLDVCVVCRGEGGNLHIVAICATSCHSLQVIVESVVDVCGRGSGGSGGE